VMRGWCLYKGGGGMCVSLDVLRVAGECRVHEEDRGCEGGGREK